MQHMASLFKHIVVKQELAMSSEEFFRVFFFVAVGFVYSRWRSIVTDGVCRQIHLTRHFSHPLLHTIRCAYHTAWLKTSHPMCLCRAHSFHPHGIHDVCLIVCCLGPSSVLLLFLSVVYRFSSFSYTLTSRINHCAFAQ